jgi:hypothetical protein
MRLHVADALLDELRLSLLAFLDGSATHCGFGDFGFRGPRSWRKLKACWARLRRLSLNVHVQEGF